MVPNSTKHSTASQVCLHLFSYIPAVAVCLLFALFVFIDKYFHISLIML